MLKLNRSLPVLALLALGALAPRPAAAQSGETELTVAGVAADKKDGGFGAGAMLAGTFPFKEKFALEGRVTFFQDKWNDPRSQRDNTAALEGFFLLRQPLTAEAWRVYGGAGAGAAWTPGANGARPELAVLFGVEWEFSRDRAIALRFEALDRQVFDISRNIPQASAGVVFRF